MRFHEVGRELRNVERGHGRVQKFMPLGLCFVCPGSPVFTYASLVFVVWCVKHCIRLLYEVCVDTKTKISRSTPNCLAGAPTEIRNSLQAW